MSKLTSFLDYLKADKVIGRADRDYAVINYQNNDTLLLFYTARHYCFKCWILVRRTSVQYYKVVSLNSFFDRDYTELKTFRSAQLASAYIQKLIRR